MRQKSYLAYPLSDLIMISHYDPDPSSDLIHHQTLGCILSSDQAKYQKPITCIFPFSQTLHEIFITCPLSHLIFSSLYTQILYQQLGPKPVMTNTLDQIPSVNTTDQIAWTKTLDLIPRTKTFVFQHVHSFPPMGVCIYVYTLFVMWTSMYTLF